MTLFSNPKRTLIDPEHSLPGRSGKMDIVNHHLTLQTPLQAPYPDGMQTVLFAMGCFWGAERKFYTHEGVFTTAVGYSGGYTPNPTYQEVCSGRSGHTESVLVVFDPTKATFRDLLTIFFEGHDPTQYMGQGNDIGTQYRSAIYCTTEVQLETARTVADHYQTALQRAGFGPIQTEIALAGPFYFAEPYHQQYLVANPQGYCGLGSTGVSCPSGVLDHPDPIASI